MGFRATGPKGKSCLSEIQKFIQRERMPITVRQAYYYLLRARVTLLSRKPSDKVQSKVLASIGKAIDENNYSWKIARITLDGKVSIE
jgi:hypothetical protein